MRSADAAVPVLTPHPLPPDVPMASWAAQLRIAIERLPEWAYVWDDEDPAVVWDAPGDPYVWDAAGTNRPWLDGVCDFMSVEIERGAPDDLGLYPPGRAVVVLDNRDGDWSTYDATGRPVYFAPGRRLAIWAHLDGADWWLFNGTIASWDDAADDTVTIEAFDGLAALAAERAPYTPGTAGQLPLDRIRSIATIARYTGTIRGDTGDVTLTRQLTELAPLEEMQIVALSDGGILAADADGAIIYRNRLWPAGRSDQTRTDLFSDNVCDIPAMVWDLRLATTDDTVVTEVELVNVAGTKVTALGEDYGIPYPRTHPRPDQWTTTAEGQAVADVLLDRGRPSVSIAGFDLYLTDPRQDLWLVGIDRRIGDRIEFLHEFPVAGSPDSAVFDIYVIVAALTHRITPDEWVTTIGTTRTLDYFPIERWDQTAWTWDQEGATWRY